MMDKFSYPTRWFLSFISLTMGLGPVLLHGQSGSWSVAQSVWNRGETNIEVQFYTPEYSSCDSEGEPFKLKVRYISPEEEPGVKAVTFQIKAINCNDDETIITFMVPIEILESDSFDNATGLQAGKLIEFESKSIDSDISNLQVYSVNKAESIKFTLKYSKKAFSIEGQKKLFENEEAEYAVDGGELGFDANWVWYADSCGGKRIGLGERIKFSTESKRRIFVRAEGPYGNSECVSKEIDFDLGSKDPITIDGINKICSGDKTTLSVLGGSLGRDAVWVWYETDCLNGKKIGTGPSITVSPSKNTFYYVRAEGPYNKTTCASINVFVFNKSVDPTLIISTDSIICAGEEVTLKVEDGKLSNDANWVWFSEQCQSRIIGNGQLITIKPEKSTTYFVKADGYCRNYNSCVPYSVKVIEKPVTPTNIQVSDNPELKNQYYLSIPDADTTLSEKIIWYEQLCDYGPVVGRGLMIPYKPKKETILFVKKENACFSSDCYSDTIRMPKNIGWSKEYQYRSFFHFSMGLGIEYHMTQVTGTRTVGSQNSAYSFPLHGIGVGGTVRIDPIMKEYFGISLKAGGAAGKGFHALFGLERELEGKKAVEQYTYNSFEFGGEVVLGFKPFKFIGSLSKNILDNHYQGDINKGTKDLQTFKVSRSLSIQRTGLGVRFGSYSGGNCLDILYTFSHETSSRLFDFNFDSVKNEIPGLSVSYWNVNSFRLSFDYRLNSAGQKWSESSFNNSTALISFYLTLDRFH